AFLYKDGAMLDLGALGGRTSRAFGINNQDQVVGSADLDSATSHAFVYQDGVMTDLGTLGGDRSEAKAINDFGQVVGQSRFDDFSKNSHTFLWTPDHPNGTTGTLTELPTLETGLESPAFDITADGRVVGDSSVVSNYPPHAYLWTPDEPNGMIGT